MDKKNLILIGIVVLMAGLFYASKNKSHSYNQSESKAGVKLVDTKKSTIESIRITKNKISLNLIQKNNVWVVKEKDSFPAEPKKIAELVNRLRELKGDTFYTSTSDPLKLSNFHLVDPNDKKLDELGAAIDVSGTKAELIDEKGNVIASVIFGKTKDSREDNERSYAPIKQSIFARKSDSNDIYLCNNFVSIDNAPSNWLNKDLLDIKKNKIKSIEIKKNEKELISVTRSKPSDKLNLVGLKESLKPNPVLIDTVGRAAESLMLESLLTDDEAKDLKFVDKFTIRDFEGLVYEFNFTEPLQNHSNHNCLHIIASIDEAYINDSSKKDDEKKDGITKLSLEQAKTQAKEFNAKNEKWHYLLANWVTKRFMKDLEELTEPIKVETSPQPDAISKDGVKTEEVNQEKITCSHILIAFKEAKNSKATRTKEEAKTLAEKLLKECLAEGSDFAKIAKENSDDSSKADGGNLGEFGKGDMVKPFESAAYSLKVDGISTVVESEFGFHIIKRTK
jgi:hypothetical protein